MPWDSAFLTIMTSTLTVTRLTGVSTDGYGRPAYSTSALKRRCRVTEKQTLVRTFDGTQELARTVCWVRSTSSFSPSDKITLPDGSTPPLLSLDEYKDENGLPHHHTLYFG
jgi:hypothetical protein